MFCLRSWIPILFFLFNNASPPYLLLFLIATYFLNRPCVYCSLLLAVLVIAIFDWRRPWFEETGSESGEAAWNSTSTALQDAVLEGAAILASGLNATAAALLSTTTKQATQQVQARSGWGAFGFGWIKDIISKGELRIHGMGVVIRL